MNARPAAPLTVVIVAGARPNFVKVAPIRAALTQHGAFAPVLVHTGQHYDALMSDVFFTELALPPPDIHLHVGSGSHAQQTAAVMTAIEPVLVEQRPAFLVVVGDVNSTLAAALVAAKLGIPVAHVEAGLRSFDRTMPEEVNRVLTDQLSDVLFTTEPAAADNLRREGIDPSRVHFVGNVMIDSLLAHLPRARDRGVPAAYGLQPHRYALLTLHRPSNVDDAAGFEQVMAAIAEIGAELPIVFPVHPRTAPALARSPCAEKLSGDGRLRSVAPLGYLEFLGLMDASAVVLTDSGGIQEETTVLGVPCLTLRRTTERPITLTHGTNVLVGTDPDRIRAAWRSVRATTRRGRLPPLWDGHAAARIVDVLAGLARRPEAAVRARVRAL